MLREVSTPFLFVRDVVAARSPGSGLRHAAWHFAHKRIPAGTRLFQLAGGPLSVSDDVDALSFTERKNPHAALEAFIRAFGQDYPHAGLVIKAANSYACGEPTARLRQLMEGCRNVYLIINRAVAARGRGADRCLRRLCLAPSGRRLRVDHGRGHVARPAGNRDGLVRQYRLYEQSQFAVSPATASFPSGRKSIRTEAHQLWAGARPRPCRQTHAMLLRGSALWRGGWPPPGKTPFAWNFLRPPQECACASGCSSWRCCSRLFPLPGIAQQRHCHFFGHRTATAGGIVTLRPSQGPRITVDKKYSVCRARPSRSFRDPVRYRSRCSAHMRLKSGSIPSDQVRFRGFSSRRTAPQAASAFGGMPTPSSAIRIVTGPACPTLRQIYRFPHPASLRSHFYSN